MPGFGWTLPAGTNQQVEGVQEQQARLLGKDIRFDGDFSVTSAGDYVLVEGVEALRWSIYRRLLTRPGEFRARPEYGVGLQDFVKKRRVQSVLDELNQRIVDQLSLDDRIEDVSASSELITDGLRITVKVRAAGETLEFKPFDFREGVPFGDVTPGAGLRIIEKEV